MCDLTREHALVATVTEKIQKYTKREVDNSRKAIEVERNSGYPSISSVIFAINSGDIANVPTTGKDFERALDIWGPSLGS